MTKIEKSQNVGTKSAFTPKKKKKLLKKRKGNNKKFIFETSNVRTKYTCTLNQTKKGTYSGIFRV